MNNYDKINVPKFEEGKEAGYLCSMCGQYTTKHESVSYMGWNLVCERCKWKMKAVLGNRDILAAIHEVGRANRALERKNTNEN